MPRLVLTLALFLLHFPAIAQGAYSNTTQLVLSNATQCANPATRTIAVADSFPLGDVDLGFIASHSWRGDIRLDLVSPAGTSVRLIVEDVTATGNPDNYNVRLDDEAASALSADSANHDPNVPPWQNRRRPSNPLSAFDGQSSDGTWTLRLCDAFPAQDNGVFQSATLLLTPEAAPSVPPLSCPTGAPERLAWTAPGGAVGWPAGATGTRSYTVGTTPVDITVGPGPFTTRNGTTTPVTSTEVSGGTGRHTLASQVDFGPGDPPVTYTLAFPDGVAAAEFTVHDVDRAQGAYQDRFTVTASSGGNPVPVTILPTVTANYSSGNTLYGLAPVPATSSDANARVVVDAPLDTITIVYGKGPSSPADPISQLTGFSLISFCPAATAELDASKTVEVVGGGHAIPGAQLLYTLEVVSTASSTATAQSLALVDTLPPTLIFSSATPSGFTGGTFSPALPATGTDCANGACVVSLQGAELPPGATGTVEVLATVK